MGDPAKYRHIDALRGYAILGIALGKKLIQLLNRGSPARTVQA